MVAPYAQAPIEIELITDLNSRPYVDMTLAIMKDFGVGIERQGYKHFTIHPASYSSALASHAHLPPGQVPGRAGVTNYQIESDASAASYFFAAPAVCGGTVKVENISRKSIQGDIGFLDILERIGCKVKEGDTFIEVIRTTELQGIDVDMRDIPDTAQTLAAIAPFSSSATRIRGIASARVKETDRVHATCTELAQLGVRVEEHEDGMTIHPCQTLKPVTIQTYNDHRMAMAFSLIGLRVDGVSIENPGCVSKTFPNYFEVLETLR
jgi:3-phosphoshikimate 1-carboxyvinyltransferase